MINREDMLELTRRMTPARTSFVRMAGCYTDSDGEYDGSFNIHFLKLSGSEKARNLAIAKKIPFAEDSCSLPLWTGAEIWNGLIFMRSVQRGEIVWPTFWAQRAENLAVWDRLCSETDCEDSWTKQKSFSADVGVPSPPGEAFFRFLAR